MSMPTMLQQVLYHVYNLSILIALFAPIVLFDKKSSFRSRFTRKTATRLEIVLQIAVLAFLLTYASSLAFARADGPQAILYILPLGWLGQLAFACAYWYSTVRKLPQQRITDMQQAVSA